MKSKNSIQTLRTQKAMEQKQQWKYDLQHQLDKIKKPFLNRIEFSKLKIQSKISNFKQQTQAAFNFQGLIQCIVQKLLQNKLQSLSQTKINSQQSECDCPENHIPTDANKENNLIFDDESQDQKQSEMPVDNHLTEWQGRDRGRVFKNSTNMQEQFDRVFNKKIGFSYPSKKRESYSYRKQEKQMLEKVYDQLKDPKSKNCVTFQRIYKFFSDCKLFFTVYGIGDSELQDIVSCSAHKYSDRLTKEEFIELFLVNTQSRTYDEMENKVEKLCCMEQSNWDELKNLFNQLDTFGKGAIKTIEFLHKMKTVSASKQLLECKVINFPNINRYYSFSKVMFQIEYKMSLPQQLSWTELKKLISNFTHIESPTLDVIVKKHIMTASIIHDQTNTFLIKDDTIEILKQQFLRCPKFNSHFVKSKYFCDELLSLESINSKSKQLVRNCPKGKGFINILANIRMLHLQGPQYIDLDEMLTYFSVKGFQAQVKMQTLNKSFIAQSTTSEEEWEEKKKEQRRAKRMKSLDHMDKIMKKVNESKYEKQQRPIFRPAVVKQFNLTKPREHMTIRQKKVKQMIQEKQQRQLSEIKPFIQANPIPATSNGQRYMEEQAKQQIKRQLQREKRLKQRQYDQKKIKDLMSNTKLFQKRDPFLAEEQKRMYLSPQPKHYFQAKPISWFIKQRNLLSMIESEKEEKRKNRLRQTKEKYVFGYWKQMPYQDGQSNFKKLTIMKSLQAYKNTNQSLQIELDSPINKVNIQRPKLGVVPDFAKLQKEFILQLESKKKMRSPTVVKQFNLSVPIKKQQEIAQEKLVKQNSPPKKNFGNPQICKTQRPAIVGTTKKFQDMVELTQRKMSLKRYEAELQELQQKERKKKEKIFAKFMKQAIKAQQGCKPRPNSMKSTRKSKDQSTIEHENELRKMYQRVLNRPFLFQTVSDSHKMKKRGRKQKKGMRKQEPKRVKIPGQQDNERGYAEIPPLNYIQEEEQDYEDENTNEIDEQGRYVVRNLDEGSDQFECEYEDEDQSQEYNKFRNSQMNQSF